MAILEEMTSYLSDKMEFENKGLELIGYKFIKNDTVYYVKKSKDSKQI